MGHSRQRLAARPAHAVLGGRRPGAIASAILALSVLTACGEDQTGPDEPLAIVPDRVTLTHVGERFSFTLRGGDADEAAWSGGDTTVFVVDQGGTVTARGNGLAYVAAATRQEGVQAVVEVSQIPTALEALGEGQSAGPGLSLLEPVGVRVLDAGGTPVGGTRIRFEPEQGSGRAEPAAAETDSLGIAWTVWTLGRAPGRQALRMVADEGGASTRIEATALDPDEVAASVEAVAGEDQWVLRGRRLPDPVVVQVLDEMERPVWGARVRFEPEAGSGRASPNAVETDSLGMAAAEWTLGNQLGPQRLVAVAGGMTAELRATAVSDEGVCNRTPEVSAEIVRRAGVEGCSAVEDDALERITQLVLSGMRIRRLRSGDFDGVPLQWLDLGDNLLTELPRDIFRGQGALVQLSLRDNLLTTLPSGVFDGMVSLDELYLENNDLMALPRGLFTDLSRLRRLSLGRNELTVLPLDIFSGLSGLKELVLWTNRLKELGPGTFSGLDDLVTLRLDGNDIEELPDDLFASLSNLRSLTMRGNRLESLPEGVLDGLPRLGYLVVGNNQLTELPPRLFAGTPLLGEIKLDYNRLRELPPDLFANTQALEGLYLNGNRLQALPDGILDGLPALTKLYLHVNELSELPRGVFSGTPRLAQLDLRINELAELPRGLFAGLSELEWARFSPNPGSPFPVQPEFVRVDDADPLAPGPAQVVVRVALGAPFAIEFPVSAQRGTVSRRVASVALGDTMSAPFEVRAGAGGGAAHLGFGVPLAATTPAGYSGLEARPGGSMVLFAESDNRIPFARTRIPAHRLQAGGPVAELVLGEHFGDPDGDSLSYELSFAEPGVVDALLVDGVLQLAPGSVDTTEVDVTAVDPGGLRATQSFRAWVVPPPDPDAFNIELMFVGPGWTPEEEATVRRAADRWMEAVTGDLPDVPITAALQRAWSDRPPRMTGVIDDVLIQMRLAATLGPGSTAGMGVYGTRDEGHAFFAGAVYALWHFRPNRLDLLYGSALHEIGHVLGIGVGQPWRDLRRGTGADAHFAGPLAVAAFDAAGGEGHSGPKVPLEHLIPVRYIHWRQSVIPEDVMSPYGELLTAITLQALADIGHEVDLGKADPYMLPTGAQGDAWAVPVPGAEAGDGGGPEALVCSVAQGPVLVVDEHGRVVRVDRP